MKRKQILSRLNRKKRNNKRQTSHINPLPATWTAGPTDGGSWADITTDVEATPDAPAGAETLRCMLHRTIPGAAPGRAMAGRLRGWTGEAQQPCSPVPDRRIEGGGGASWASRARHMVGHVAPPHLSRTEPRGGVLMALDVTCRFRTAHC